MNQTIDIIKGVHPGLFLERELKKRHLTKGRFAMSVGEYPQTFGDITKGKRKMNVGLSLKIEKALGLEEGFLMILQTYFDIAKEKRKLNEHKKPDLTQFRPALFWDTDLQKIDWQKQKTAIVKRVFNRGNDLEKEELQNFYGQEIIDQILKDE